MGATLLTGTLRRGTEPRVVQQSFKLPPPLPPLPQKKRIRLELSMCSELGVLVNATGGFDAVLRRFMCNASTHTENKIVSTDNSPSYDLDAGRRPAVPVPKTLSMTDSIWTTTCPITNKS